MGGLRNLSQKYLLSLWVLFPMVFFGMGLPMDQARAASSALEIPFLYVETTPNDSFNVGEKVTVKVRLTREDGITPLAGRKIILALNQETFLRKVVVTGSDGWGTAEISLGNRLDSSCCMYGKRTYVMPYSLNVVFPGEGSYARQEVVGIISIRGAGGQRTRIEYSAPNKRVADGKLVVNNLIPKLASGGGSIGFASVCVDKYCTDPVSLSPTLNVSRLPRGSYVATIYYGGDPVKGYSGAYANFGVYIDNTIPRKDPPLKGIYNGWDYANARPEHRRDKNGRPMGFDGLDIKYWRDFYASTEAIANEIRNTPIKITLPDGTQRYKRYITGISPLAFGDPPVDMAPSGLSYNKIPLRNCGGGEMPDFKDPRWQEAFKQELYKIADWWKSHPEYQDIIVGVRVGGGYDGEWGNGPAKRGCAKVDVARYYKPSVDINDGAAVHEAYMGFMSFWHPLAVRVHQWAAEASARSRTGDGKQLYFIFEGNPTPAGRMAEPAVGYKWNALNANGLQIYHPQIAAGTCIECGIGYYRHFYPSHFGGLETQSGNFGYGQWSWQPDGAKAAGGYWSSLLALKSGADFLDFHPEYWAIYRYQPGFDAFMQSHFMNRCDGVSDGFIAFREVADNYRKEMPPCGPSTTPKCAPGDPGYNADGITLNYGDVDTCLYVPRLPGVQLEPVRNNYYRGAVEFETGKWQYTKAKAQHYINAGDTNIYHSRRLVSQFAYVDIDEGLTSRMGNKWEITVVYYDGHPGEKDTFSVDYYSTDGSLKSLVVTKQGTEEFKVASWVLNDLKADNSFTEASADLRLNNRNDGPDIFHSIYVRGFQGSTDAAPTPPQNFSVTLGN